MHNPLFFLIAGGSYAQQTDRRGDGDRFQGRFGSEKPKSWLKSVSAFANGIGGVLLFGVVDDRSIVGLTNAQQDAEAISHLIKERITPTSAAKTYCKFCSKNILHALAKWWPIRYNS